MSCRPSYPPHPFTDAPRTASFADNQLTDALRNLSTEPGVDPKVKRKLVNVLAAWHAQFKDDPSMSLVANMYNTVKPSSSAVSRAARRSEEDMYQIDAAGLGMQDEERRRKEEKERKEKEKEERRKAKEAKEAERLRQKKAVQEKRRSKGKTKRQPFNFEQVRAGLLVWLMGGG